MANPKVIALVGDSLSLPLKKSLRFSGLLIDHRDMEVSFANTYPAQLQMGISGIKALITTHAERGATTSNLSPRLTNIIRNFQPDAFVLNIGTSDCRFRPKTLRRVGGELWQKVSLSEFSTNLSECVMPLKMSGALVVTLSILPASSEVLRKYPGSDEIFNAYNEVLAAFTRAIDGTFVNLAARIVDVDQFVTSDGFHYNTRMHSLVAATLNQVIWNALAPE